MASIRMIIKISDFLTMGRHNERIEMSQVIVMNFGKTVHKIAPGIHNQTRRAGRQSH
jgi:hypothetical protein